MLCPEGPQGPDEEGLRGRPDPAVGASSAWGVGWEYSVGALESHYVSPVPLGSSPYPGCGWLHRLGTAKLQGCHSYRHYDDPWVVLSGGLGPVPVPGLHTLSKLP